jgi:hypothetical protein
MPKGKIYRQKQLLKAPIKRIVTKPITISVCKEHSIVPQELYVDDFVHRLITVGDDKPLIAGRWFGDTSGLWYHDTSKVLGWRRKNNHLNDIIRMRTISSD